MALPVDDIVFRTAKLHSRLAWVNRWFLSKAELPLGLAFKLVDNLFEV